MLQEKVDESSQRSVILDGSPKSVHRLEQSQLEELEGGPSSHLVPLVLDGALTYDMVRYPSLLHWYLAAGRLSLF